MMSSFPPAAITMATHPTMGMEEAGFLMSLSVCFNTLRLPDSPHKPLFVEGTCLYIPSASATGAVLRKMDLKDAGRSKAILGASAGASEGLHKWVPGPRRSPVPRAQAVTGQVPPSVSLDSVRLPAEPSPGPLKPQANLATASCWRPQASSLVSRDLRVLCTSSILSSFFLQRWLEGDIVTWPELRASWGQVPQ